jgi:hypothetical protein
MRITPLALGAVLSVLAVPSVAPAAATPCWKTVIADWSKDNRVDGRYPATCIRDAMIHAPTDLKIYSSVEEDLQSALRARSVRRLAGVHGGPAASIAAPNGSSSFSPLVIVLGGLGVLVAACTAVVLFRRRRAAS